jgi:hypothetical protein
VQGLKENIMLLFGWVGLNYQCLKHYIDNGLQCLNSLRSPIPPRAKASGLPWRMSVTMATLQRSKWLFWESLNDRS